MRCARRLIARVLCATFVVALGAVPDTTFAATESDAFLAISDGRGTVSLFWYPAASHLTVPAFRLSELRGDRERTIVARVVPGDPSFASAIAAPSFHAASNVTAAFEQARAKGTTRQVALFLGIKIFTDYSFAQAAGFARVLRPDDTGPRRYRVVELDAAGAPTSVTIESNTVDPGIASTPVTPVSGLHASASGRGVDLGWKPPAAASAGYVLAYDVARTDDGHGRDLTPIPLLVGTTWSVATQYSDRDVPLDTTPTYAVRAIDVFGRRSEPVSVSAYALDGVALAPIRANVVAQNGGALVSWKPRDNPHLAGYVVERGTSPHGPFDVLTPRGVTATTATYADPNLSTGTTYYYRVLAMGPRGDLGTSDGATQLPALKGLPPNTPSGLRAVAGATRVRLTWDAPAAPIAGVEVERRTLGKWYRITQTPVVVGRYDDRFGVSAGATVAYRIDALGHDGQRSVATSPVVVSTQDDRVPGRTSLLVAVTKGTTVHLAFRGPLGANEPQHTLAVYRSTLPSVLGTQVAHDLAADAQTYDDSGASPGARETYRVVAISAAGIVGAPSAAKTVIVGATSLPKPAAPRATYASTPFKSVELMFSAPPAGLRIAIFGLDRAGRFVERLRDITGTQALDPRPPSGTDRYRIAYIDGAGRHGPLSDVVTVAIP